MKKGTAFILLGISICFLLILSSCSQSNDSNAETSTDDESNEINQKEDEPNHNDSNRNLEDDSELNNSDDPSEESTGNNNENNEEASDSSQSNDSTDENDNSTSNKESTDDNNVSNNNEDVTEISNMEEAVSHLKNELANADEINVDDTEFVPDDSTDQTQGEEKIYTISLVSKSLKEDGGSGSIGTYNVYENGEYELSY